MKITEIFFSIQGESTFNGLPCIFIRLTGCNLRCSYCDTTYSYEGGKDWSIDDILKELEIYQPVKLVEITGGEPLLQPECLDLIKELHQRNYTILLETNGSKSLENIPKYVHKIMDIKCPGSGESESFLSSNLDYLNIGKDEIKFVISDLNDYQWAKDTIKKFTLEKHKILISTVFDKLQPKEAIKWIIEDRLDVRFQLQLHKYIWDPNKKGV